MSKRTRKQEGRIKLVHCRAVNCRLSSAIMPLILHSETDVLWRAFLVNSSTEINVDVVLQNNQTQKDGRQPRLSVWPHSQRYRSLISCYEKGEPSFPVHLTRRVFLFFIFDKQSNWMNGSVNNSQLYSSDCSSLCRIVISLFIVKILKNYFKSINPI